MSETADTSTCERSDASQRRIQSIAARRSWSVAVSTALPVGEMQDGFAADSLDGPERQLPVLVRPHPMLVRQNQLELQRRRSRVQDEDIHVGPVRSGFHAPAEARGAAYGP
jgi:hypothetical protein